MTRFALDSMRASDLRYHVRKSVNDLRSARRFCNPVVEQLRLATLRFYLNTYWKATR